MRFFNKRQLLAFLLFVILTATFLWCIVANIVTSTQTSLTENHDQASLVVVATGMLWLIGHGVHGAAALAVPLMILSGRKKQSGQLLSPINDGRENN